MRKLFLAAVLGVAAAGAGGASGANDNPYAGQEKREIKALSYQEISGYLNGSGMGYAKAAELNQFPGPRHVLDLSEQLDLTPQQMSQTRMIFHAMKARASQLGALLVEKERELDSQFADGTIDENSLEKLVFDIGSLAAKIRQVHLKAHLEQRALLSEHQVHQYSQLRGYAAGVHGSHKHTP